MNTELYQQIVNNTADSIITIDTQGLVHSFNPAAGRLFGYMADDVIGKNVTCLMSEADKDLHNSYIQRYLETGQGQIIGNGLREVVAQRKDGSTFPAGLTVSAMQLADGQNIFIGQMRDISWRKQAEEKLRASEQRFELVTRGTKDGIWDWDLTTGQIYFSPRWKTMLGYDETEIEENFMALQDLIHPDDLGIALEKWIACMEGETDAFMIEYRLRSKQNNHLYEQNDYLWIECRGLVQLDDEGNPVRMAGSHTDITNRKQAYADLEQMAMNLETKAEALERTNQELDQFAYVASHDLKAPLRAIANLSQWIEEDLEEVMTDDTRKQMALLRGRVKRLEDLINGILQYSRVGRVDMDTEDVDVGEMLVEIIDSLAPPSSFNIDIAPNMPILQSTRVVLSQIFTNILSNAIKYHDRPESAQITVSMRLINSATYEFSVTDNGPGIASEYHDKVFQIFQTLQARDTVESTGIGLTVVKKIVEQLGGQMFLDSAEGEGATFRFTLPNNSIESTVLNDEDEVRRVRSA